MEDGVKSYLRIVFAVVAVSLIAYNIYKGATVKEIGVPGFTISFEKKPAANGSDQTTSPTPASTPGFLKTVSGSYRLTSWNEAHGPNTLGVGAKEGTLTISGTGDASWEIVLLDLASGAQPSPEPRITCRGKVDLSSKELKGLPGQGNNSINWSRNIDSVAKDVWPTFCGWYFQVPDSPFSLPIDNGTLQMENRRGTFTWSKL